MHRGRLLEAADRGGIDELVTLLRRDRGDLVVKPADFAGYSLGARFFPLLYLLTRVTGARDFWNGAPKLSAHLAGKLNVLQVHHIFPKAKLYPHGYERGVVNAIANFCYLTQETNRVPHPSNFHNGQDILFDPYSCRQRHKKSEGPYCRRTGR